MSEKAKYWTCILYPESMVDDWQDKICDILQVPFAYCIHDKDKDGHDGDRKIHVHVEIAFPNTTTKNLLTIRTIKTNHTPFFTAIIFLMFKIKIKIMNTPTGKIRNIRNKKSYNIRKKERNKNKN